MAGNRGKKRRNTGALGSPGETELDDNADNVNLLVYGGNSISDLHESVVIASPRHCKPQVLDGATNVLNPCGLGFYAIPYAKPIPRFPAAFSRFVYRSMLSF